MFPGAKKGRICGFLEFCWILGAFEVWKSFTFRFSGLTNEIFLNILKLWWIFMTIFPFEKLKIWIFSQIALNSRLKLPKTEALKPPLPPRFPHYKATPHNFAPKFQRNPSNCHPSKKPICIILISKTFTLNLPKNKIQLKPFFRIQCRPYKKSNKTKKNRQQKGYFGGG